ncbi:hypothetical protein A2363_00445 [Candidatus Gottesmanbacteria bacterium RIFOXYB1_FULL_47_11]|uniref:Cell envelope-related transcriptional attenuator domain-containing protein n=1 Tax=Candidatus Gottesmanbacteria bacterium RIFOXYB1_FULL_47_11 TaxID=1798401 RepID=A0A1F6BBY9_9BACT|nr:MAG: hypothetical protein A2363_00445 [Candidatus Gottesmanbacteria bacterium RIFOXYB1_FULL_47_11]
MKKVIFFVITTLLLFFAVKTIPGIATVAKLVFNGGAPLASSSDRTNILLLGIGGGNHEGSDLTDTMMVLSLDNKKKTSAFISVPRDIWSETLKDRVNSAYHYGEEKKKGGGLLLAKVTVEDIVGMPIHYAVVVDFSGFQNLIDQVDGIEVVVPTAFTDTQYPKPGMEESTCPGDPTNACVYETVHFDAGLQHMDGARALVYARSRHAEGDEGSDFARSRRQQLIIVALKNKLMRPLTWFTVSRMKSLPSVLDDATDMDMTMSEALTIGKRFVGVGENDIKKISFEDKLEVPPSYVYGKYVLVPTEDWESIHSYIKAQVLK